MCGGSLLIPAISGEEMSTRRCGITHAPTASLTEQYRWRWPARWPAMTWEPSFGGLHQLRRIGADAAGIAGLGTREAEIVAHSLQSGDRRARIILCVHNQRAGHAEHCVGVNVLVVGEIQS